MFTDSIIKYEIDKNKRIEEKAKGRNNMYNNLSRLDKYLLNRTQTLISKIVSQIEKESGWEYFLSEFTYLSDFELVDGDITFKVNKVPLDYNLDELNEREFIFVEKYLPLLRRLSDLENKSKIYIIKGTEKGIEEEKPKNSMFGESFISTWTEKEAKKFMNNFGDVGVNRLVHILNDISENEDVDKLYSDFMKQNIPENYKRELLKWASTYSIRGNILLERFVNYRDRVVNLDNSLYFKNK